MVRLIGRGGRFFNFWLGPEAGTLATMDNTELPPPQREAAFFFGMFLRGHSIEALRQDIDVPREVAAKWLRSREELDPGFPATARRILEYRKQVLAIFNFLVSSESAIQHKM